MGYIPDVFSYGRRVNGKIIDYGLEPTAIPDPRDPAEADSQPQDHTAPSTASRSRECGDQSTSIASQ